MSHSHLNSCFLFYMNYHKVPQIALKIVEVHGGSLVCELCFMNQELSRIRDKLSSSAGSFSFLVTPFHPNLPHRAIVWIKWRRREATLSPHWKEWQGTQELNR